MERPIVLVGVDYSAASRRALDHAATQVRDGRGALVLAHVLECAPYRLTRLEQDDSRKDERDGEIAEALSTLVMPLRAEVEDAGTAVEASVVRHGHVAETLMALAREHSAGQIVVGRTGEGRVHTLVFGSAPSHLVQVSPVPVTVVP